MTLEAKKYSLIRWIISVADERMINEIEKVKSGAGFEFDAQSQTGFKAGYTTSMKEIESKMVDVNRLKEEQNYRALSTGELDDIIEEANIEQSLEELLADLKEIG